MRILDNLIYRAEKFEDPKAAFQLAVIFETGDRVEPNPAKAREWLEKAADLGHEEAERRLGRLKGERVKPRVEKPVTQQPPVIKEPARITREVHEPQCPNGHGPLRDWDGDQRCWVCGWPNETAEPETAEAQPAVPQPAGPVSWIAVAAFVLGILGFLTNGITSVPAVLFGYFAKNKLEKPGPRHAVDPFLTQFGLILGYAGVALNFQYLIYLIFGM